MGVGRWLVVLIAVASAACASTIGPATPPVEVLVVIDSLDDTVRVIPVDSPSVVHHLLLSHSAPATALALDGRVAAIGFGDSIIMLDLGSHSVICRQPLSGKGPVGSITFTDAGQAYAATPSTDKFAFVDLPPGCGIGQDSVSGKPQGFATARGTVFVMVSAPSASWLLSLDAQRDSIPLGPPGTPRAAVAGSDGSVYVVQAGSDADTTADGVLVRVDPVQRAVVASFAGFGRKPMYAATDGADNVYVASPIEGLMVFNVRTHSVARGAGSNAVALADSVHGLATDDFGRVYALITGTCALGDRGAVQPLDVNLVAQHPITVGRCPVGIGVTEIPAALYHFDN